MMPPSSSYPILLLINILIPTINSQTCDPCTQTTGSIFKVVPNTNCVEYVQCINSKQIGGTFRCSGDTIYDDSKQYCNWVSSVTCIDSDEVDCMPERIETDSPTQRPTSRPAVTQKPVSPTLIVNVPDGTINGDTLSPGNNEDETVDCDETNPCPTNYTGYQTKPNTNCQSYIECKFGIPVGEYDCPTENTRFIIEFGAISGKCSEEVVVPTGWTCPLDVSCTIDIDIQLPISTDSPTTLEPTTASPTTKPTIQPETSTYQMFRNYILQHEDEISFIFNKPDGTSSTKYKFDDFIIALDVSALQLPSNKAFFSGSNIPGRLPRITGMEYGLVNVAAFLSNVKEVGIRYDTCDEWNTEYEQSPHEKYPLSNACGQYGRSYEDEVCVADEPFHCVVDTFMEVMANDYNVEENLPPFMCKPREFNVGQEVYPGYYDTIDKVVIQSPYANTVGRTDVAGCCWWGRGVMLTKGTCTLGKLDIYLGQGAVDRGIYVYPDINFCLTPEAICNHEKSNELRWVLGLLEWTDRIQSYVDPLTGWNYMDQLQQFVNDGMVGTDFIKSVVNIVTRNCDDLCPDKWPVGDKVYMENRVDHFRRLVFEVFNLPFTYQPTLSPSPPPSRSPSLSPTITAMPATPKPTRKKKVIALPPNKARDRLGGHSMAMLMAILVGTFLLLCW